MVLGVVAAVVVGVSVPGVKKPVSGLFASTQDRRDHRRGQARQAGGDRQGEGESRKLRQQGRPLRGRGRHDHHHDQARRHQGQGRGGRRRARLGRPPRRRWSTRRSPPSRPRRRYKQAKLVREVAEYAVKEYVEGIYRQDKATYEGQIALASPTWSGPSTGSSGRPT